jgi:hypothetical protein
MIVSSGAALTSCFKLYLKNILDYYALVSMRMIYWRFNGSIEM